MLDGFMERLLAFARKLQNVSTLEDLLALAREECRNAIGYRNVWLHVSRAENGCELRWVVPSDGKGESSPNGTEVVDGGSDPLMREVLDASSPVVIEDAHVDPRTREARVGLPDAPTAILLPLRLGDQVLGVFGCGSLPQEGCRPPSVADLEYLAEMANQVVVAVSRIRFVEMRATADRDRLELERRLTQVQRLESLGMLAGGIAHDFNNLLTVLTVSASLALEQADTTALRTEIETILDAAQRGEDLTRQLLAMSRSQELELRPIDMNAHLKEVLRLIRRTFPDSIEIVFEQGVALPLIEGDVSQLDQVFMNLLIHARDAMPTGGRLTVRTEEVVVDGRNVVAHPWAKSGSYVMVTIADTGVAMSRDLQDRVFEPSFQSTGPRVGTGLGLAVSYGIIRQHRGMAHCHSEEGVGTSFRIHIPAMASMVTEIGHKLQRTTAGGREHVLVAEDDEFVRAVAVKILERAGYEVKAVEDGEAACRAALMTCFDLAILDVVMPGLSCRDTIARLRTLRPHTPIVLSTGYTAGSNTSVLVKQTGFELLTKPYDPDRMLHVVRAALDARRTLH